MEIRKYNVTTQASRQRQLDVLGAEEQRYDALVTQGLKDNPYHAADNKDGETKKGVTPNKHQRITCLSGSK